MWISWNVIELGCEIMDNKESRGAFGEVKGGYLIQARSVHLLIIMPPYETILSKEATLCVIKSQDKELLQQNKGL